MSHCSHPHGQTVSHCCMETSRAIRPRDLVTSSPLCSLLSILGVPSPVARNSPRSVQTRHLHGYSLFLYQLLLSFSFLLLLPIFWNYLILHFAGFRMSAYEEIRNSLTKNDKNGFPMWKKVLAGMLAGGIGQLMASPTDLIKTQIQMEGRRRLLGKPPRVHGTWDAAR